MSSKEMSSPDELLRLYSEKNEQQFRKMINALPAAIYTTDAEGRLTHFNPAAVEFSGREPQIGSDQWCVTWKLYHPDGTPMPHDKCPMAQAMQEGRSISGAEAIAERPDGERIWFEAYPSPLRDEEGEIIGGINMLLDITERKQAEKQSAQSEQKFTDLFNNATVGLHFVGPDGIIQRANQAELDLLGYSREEYVGSHIADHHVDQDVIEDILEKLSSGVELDNYEARLRCKDGTIKHVIISSDVYWEDDEFVHTRCFTRDITKRKRTEQLHKERNKLLELIASGAPLEKCFSSLSNTISRLEPGVRVSIMFADEQGQSFNRPIAPDFPLSYSEELEGAPISDFAIGTCGEAVYENQKVICKDIANTDKWSEEWRDLCLSNDILACLSQPIYNKQEQAVGSFMLCFDKPREPDEWEHRMAEFGAHVASIAFERDRSQKALRENKNRLASWGADMERLHDLSTRLLMKEDVDTALHEVMMASAELLHADKCSVQIYDKQNDILKLVSSFGFDERFDQQFQTVNTGSITTCATALRQREQVLVEDLSNDPEYAEFYQTVEDYGARAAFSTPLYGNEDQLLGMFTMYWDNPHHPNEKELQLLDLYTQQAARQIERKQSAEALRESERWFRKLLEKLPAAAYTCDAQGLITYFNQQAAEVWGREPELNSSVDRFCGSVQLYLSDGTPIDHHECWMALVLKNEKEYNEKEIIIERPDGQRVNGLAYATPIRDRSGKLVGAINIVVDISERKQTEEKLRKSEEHLNSIFKTTPECIKIVAEDGTLLRMNPAGLEMVEAESDSDVIDGNVYDLIAPEHREEFKAFNKKICGGESGTLEFDVIGLQGTRRHMESHATPLLRPDGTVVHLALTRDITRRKQDEKKLRKSEERFRALVTASSDIVYRMSPDWSEMRHLDGRDFLADTQKPSSNWLVRYIHPDDYERVKKAINEAIETKSMFELEHRVQQVDGAIGWTYSRAIPILNDDNEIIEWFGAAKDVTDRKRAEEKLKKVNETLEERVEERTDSLLSYQDQLRSLASQLSKAEEEVRQRLATELHDNLGQMLAMGKMKIDALQNGQLSGQISSELDKLRDLMENSLTYTRNLMSDLKPPPTLDKEDVRATIVWLAQKMEEQHDLEVTLDDDNQPKRTSEEIRTILLQCTRELLFNVIKHSGVKRARVNMSRLDDQVQIFVEDKGMGFDPEKNTSVATEEGRFGLFNIRERIDLIGGSTEIYSEPGEGTKVKLTAPLKTVSETDLNEQSDQDEIEYSPRENVESIKVILADDHEMMRKGLKEIVNEEDDLEVVAEASDGEEAVTLAQKFSPDVIIMDVNMPLMDGIEATKEVLSIMPKTKIVGLSLHDDKEVKDSLLTAGASAYLSKNEAFKTLCATIRSEVS